MTYALVVNNNIQSEGGLPSSARRLDTQAWVLGLPTASIGLQKACGYHEVVMTFRPADTATHTTDRSLVWASQLVTETWTSRPKTQVEIDGAAATTNEATIKTNLEQDLVVMQATIDAANSTINANPASYIKDIARMNKRLGREAIKKYDSAN